VRLPVALAAFHPAGLVVEHAVAILTQIPLILSIAAVFDHRLRPVARAIEAIAALVSEFSTSNGNISGDAAASPLPATLLQRQLYLTNNLLPKSVLTKSCVR
jgi:hypothetical protein